MLRRKSDLSSATHISAQYGIVFRHFLGGPGQFVPPCNYEKLKYAPVRNFPDGAILSVDRSAALYSQGVPFANADGTGTSPSSYILEDIDRECTVLPSSGWVSPELRNTISYTQSGYNR